MPSFRKKPGDKGNYLKRRTLEQGKAELDAAHVATQRLFCEVLGFWRRCSLRTCKHHRRCLGQPTGCIMRGLMHVPPALRLKAQKRVIAGGPRRLKPQTHIEWIVRRTELKTLLSWGFGVLPKDRSLGATK